MRRKLPKYVGSDSWKDEQREKEVRLFRWRLERAGGREKYEAAYDQAEAMLKAGHSIEEIRSRLIRPATLRPMESGASAGEIDATNYANKLAEALAAEVRRGVEQALAGKPKDTP